MSILGTLAVLASFGLSIQTGSFSDWEARAEGQLTSGFVFDMEEQSPLINRLRLLDEAETHRGEELSLPTPVGRVKVMLLWAEAQQQLGSLEDPLKEAVVQFAPAGCFSRKERPMGRVVVSLPVARF